MYLEKREQSAETARELRSRTNKILKLDVTQRLGNVDKESAPIDGGGVKDIYYALSRGTAWLCSLEVFVLEERRRRMTLSLVLRLIEQLSSMGEVNQVVNSMSRVDLASGLFLVSCPSSALRRK